MHLCIMHRCMIQACIAPSPPQLSLSLSPSLSLSVSLSLSPSLSLSLSLSHLPQVPPPRPAAGTRTRPALAAPFAAADRLVAVHQPAEERHVPRAHLPRRAMHKTRSCHVPLSLLPHVLVTPPSRPRHVALHTSSSSSLRIAVTSPFTIPIVSLSARPRGRALTRARRHPPAHSNRVRVIRRIGARAGGGGGAGGRGGCAGARTHAHTHTHTHIRGLGFESGGT